MVPELRSATPADLDAIHALNRRVEQHDAFPIATPREEFQEWLDDPHLDLAADTRVAESNGEIVGWARIYHRPATGPEARAFLFGGTDPAHRRRRIGSALLEWEIGRAEQIVRAAPPALPRFVCTQVYDFQKDVLRLYERAGFSPVRYNDELLRPLDSLPETRPVPGVTIVPWDSSRSEEARHAQNDAFRDHWGSMPRDRASWDHVLAAFGSRLDLSFLALEEGRVVGVCRNAVFPGDEAVTGRRDGWIFNVSVLRSHRKRGIASALIVASLHVFRAAGLTHSALGVDSENPTGAYALYTRLGYRPMHRSVVLQRNA